MQKTVVITGAGRDRVGIVAELADFLFQLGCNLLDSSMTLLRGEFALILMATLPENMDVDELRARLAGLQEKLVLNFAVRELSLEELAEQDTPSWPFIISVYGADKPGIVAGITRKLAELKINVTDVQTKSVSRDGREVFVMMLEVTSPAETAAPTLQSQLTSFAANLGVAISVRELEIMEL
jgi:glycine cleavage system transcriptional repressor